MTNHLFRLKLSKLITITLSVAWLLSSNLVSAGICDISGSSGIGGTGAPSHNTGIGGTGAIAFGIGGTGKPIKKTGSGIGGTGAIANGSGIGGTGKPVAHNGLVVGTITGFGSICVNGIEIHYSSDTPLQRDGQDVTPDDSLKIGQVVAVGVSGLGKEVTANEMVILHAASGPISNIDFVKGEIEVLGQKVHFDINSGNSPALNSLQAGDHIAVSGLRDPIGHIVASRIDPIAMQESASLRGPVTAISNNSFDIQGITVNAAAPKNVSVGQELHISGRVDIDGFKADGVVIHQQAVNTAEIGGLISVEGYLTNSNTMATVEVAGRVVEIPDDLRSKIEQISAHERVVVTGRLAEGSIIQLEQMLVDLSIPDPENLHHSVDNTSHREDNEKNTPQDTDSDETDSADHQKIESIEDKEHDQELDALERPESEDHESPEVDEHESHELEALELPEADEHESHEFEAPELPEIEENETPEFEAPELPEIEEHETPEFEAPELPEIEEHETPEFEAPELPEIEEHETPEFEAPELPEIEEYETPEFEVPEHEDHEH